MEPPADLNKITPSQQEQASIINECLQTRVEKGQTWYLIDQSWIKSFRRYVGLDEAERYALPKFPGPVDNAALLDEFGNDIRIGLVEGLDFVLVPEFAWKLLSSWYGIVKGQQPICRQTIEFGTFVKHCKVEVYLIQLNLCNNFDLSKSVLYKFSAADLIQKIENVMRNIYQIPSESDTRLWGSYSSGQFDLLPLNKAIQDIPLAQNQFIVIESKPADQQWESPLITNKKHSKQSISYIQVPPSTSKGSSLRYNRPSQSMPPVTRRTASSTVLGVTGYGAPTKPGLSGLVNIGNTCFMNSIIQCLSHCPPLTCYFIDNIYVSDINYNNSQGAGGDIAKCFGNLLHMLWSGKHATVVPDKFKLKIGQFSNQFSSGSQQDAQEFMVFFLDLLHEDLNKVSIKPLTPPISYDSRPDDELANETWSNYKQKNDSFIVDNFHGLLKSRVVCPTCERVSSTFDPFVFLSLPLLMRKERELQVRHIPFTQNLAIVEYLISVPYEGSIQDVYLEMARYTNVPMECMILAEVVNNHCHRFFSYEEPISCIRENCTLVLFDVPIEMGSEVLKSHIIMPGVLWEVSGQDRPPYRTGVLFGNPFLVVLPSTAITYQALYNLIMARMTRYITGCSTMPSTSYEKNGAEVMNMEVEMTPLKLFAVNGIDYRDAHEIPDDGSLISFEDSTGRETVAVQWTSAVRSVWFKDPVPDFRDTITCKSAVKLSLEDCLSVFITSEKLGADDTWICPDCKVYKRASKKFDLWQLPTVLVFHLKRFAYNKGKRDKIDVFVDFPITNLHMEKYTCTTGQEKLIYDLFAVCNHYGSLHAGHYTAYAKTQRDDRWYCFDDSIVTSHKESKVVTSAAYLLFYIRRGEQIPKVPTPCESSPSSATSLTLPTTALCVSPSNVMVSTTCSSASAGTSAVSTITIPGSPVGSESTIGSGSSVDTDTGIESDADMPLAKYKI